MIETAAPAQAHSVRNLAQNEQVCAPGAEIRCIPFLPMHMQTECALIEVQRARNIAHFEMHVSQLRLRVKDGVGRLAHIASLLACRTLLLVADRVRRAYIRFNA